MDTPLNLQDAILNLQTYLRAISFVDDRIERVPIDGIFDTDTEKAVTSFQRTRGLSPTGIVDKETWDAIYEEFKILNQASDRSQKYNFFPTYPENYESELGEESAFISLAQILLRELSVIYDSFENVKITGVFDKETEDAVKVIQKSAGLPVTGKINLATWNVITRDFSNYAPF